MKHLKSISFQLKIHYHGPIDSSLILNGSKDDNTCIHLAKILMTESSTEVLTEPQIARNSGFEE